MYATLLAVAALWGAAAGLLVPRAAYRISVEPGEPWRDSCPSGHRFAGPVRGWIGGVRCAACATAVPAVSGRAADGVAGPSPDAPATPVTVPLVTIAACVAVAAATGVRPELAVWLLIVPFAVLLAVVDLRVHRLPDGLTLPLAAAAALLLGPVALLSGHAGSWTTALLGGLVLGGAYFVLFVIHPNGMGFGDVKLALSLGVVLGWYGWTVLFAGAFAGFLFGSLYGVVLMALGRAGRRTAIPFGPFMMAGALLGLLLGALAVRG
ncbi:A24 family peptidase [Streptomyces sp. NBC_00306]|uniref:A24 family peptidase n=1 Tax=Streptomyces sp. NBC_00306 TaxID=2975708 RepID=UPI002E299134|nr:A24 family peptidase [Streptomyces sp. NBC_00306]